MAGYHELKILPQYFSEVVWGQKTFEVRKNDRNFETGDTVKLREYDGKEYTGNYVEMYIGFITDYAQKDDYVVFSILPFDGTQNES